jgi:isopenicillin-N N-acyltransferase like protein
MAEKRHRALRKLAWILAILGALVILLIVLFRVLTTIRPPTVTDRGAENLKVTQVDSGFSTCGKGWLKHNSEGLWELYLEGEPFERGVTEGKLTKELLDFQEEAFIGRIREMVPSPSYLKFLKYFIYWFNRNMDKYMPEEFKEEIYGISLSVSDKFSFIGSPYQRMLNYHSAHDIGHALQNMHLVGCTAFGVWNGRSKDGSLLIGRNFDFYVGDDFAKNKIVCFEKPSKGIPFMSITWAGMTGVVSGMNLKGLTVTINAAKSDIPWSSRTPISVLAREILQYAGNIEEAYKISKEYKTFVSESLLIGSAADNKAVILEKSPEKTAIFDPGRDYIICANHFQSEEFAGDPNTLGDRNEMVSVYRAKRVLQDITDNPVMDPATVATILRDRAGLNGKDIGMGNEKAINQLTCHHSVIFDPVHLKVWVSTAPWQDGAYACYSISEIFNKFAVLKKKSRIALDDQRIAPDSFPGSGEYDRFLRFRADRSALQKQIRSGEKKEIDRSFIDGFITTNPLLYDTWVAVGDVYRSAGMPDSAIRFYQKALQCEVPRTSEKKQIIGKLSECRIKAKTNER